MACSRATRAPGELPRTEPDPASDGRAAARGGAPGQRYGSTRWMWLPTIVTVSVSVELTAPIESFDGKASSR